MKQRNNGWKFSDPEGKFTWEAPTPVNELYFPLCNEAGMMSSIVGGGAKNKYLNKLTAEACKKEVIALPIEATALGNLKIQMERKQ